MTQNPRLLIVIATYNEIDSLPPLVEQLSTLLPNEDILVIDDNSPDGTGRWCEQSQPQYPHLQVIHRPDKSGLGSATLLGLNWAIDEGYELVATLDADFSHDPYALAAMLQLINSDELGQTDVVIGSRYVCGGKIVGWPWYRVLSSRLLNAYVRIVLRLKVNDSSGALRIYRTRALKKANLSQIQSTGYSYLEEILWRLQNTGATMMEHPIVFTNRKQGKSKANYAEIADSLGQIVKLSLKRKKSHGGN